MVISLALNCYSISFLIFRSPSHGGSLTLYSSLWTILTIHLFIIWALIWVPVPSDTLFGFLWVVLAKLPCLRRAHLDELITIEYKNQLECYGILFIFFQNPSHGGSLTLYSSIWIILTIYLFIIWVITWVLVPSDTLFGFLWVVLAKAALFRSLFHINAIRKVAAMYLMRWQQLSLRYSWISFLLVCS